MEECRIDSSILFIMLMKNNFLCSWSMKGHIVSLQSHMIVHVLAIKGVMSSHPGPNEMS